MKKFKIYLFILITSILYCQIAVGAENDYGIAKAWFNGQNATVNGIQLKIGEQSEIKLEVISKIDGNVFIKILEPGTSKAFEILSGPSKQDERIDNLKVAPGWSRTLTWIIRPNGAWKNGNAPINVFVEFSKIKDDKKIQFTIANPYILDEQYSGTVEPETTASRAGTQTKPTPFLSVIFTVSALLLAWRLGRAE